MRRPAKKLSNNPRAGTVTGDDLLSLFLQLDGVQKLSNAVLAQFSLVSSKCNAAVKSRVSSLQLSVACLADAQKQLEWQQLHSWAPPQAVETPAVAAAAAGPSTRSTRSSSRRAAQQQQPDDAAAVATADAAAVVAHPPSRPNLLVHLAQRMQHLSKLKLFYNTVQQASTLGEQLALIALVTQLTSLSLCDAASCSMPSSGLSHVSKLTALKELNLIVQSTGQRMAFDSSYPLWSANVMRAMGHVSVLTGLQAVQLRFICGDRGFFFSEKLLTMIRPLTQVTYLDLGYIDLPPGGLAQLSDLAQLQKCVLYGRLSRLSAMDLTVLSSWPRLQRLEMFHDCPAHMDTLAPGAPPLRLDADEIEQLSSTFSSMQHLSWLNLPMVNTTTPVLPLLGKLPALEQLYLQSIEREQAVLKLEAASIGPSVKVLQIDNVRLTSEELDRLAALTQLQQLTMFNLQLQEMGSSDALSRLSKLTCLQGFTFDALAADDPVPQAVIDRTVLRSLVPAWQQLRSLHLSYSALPDVADQPQPAQVGDVREDFKLNFGGLKELQHLSVYASPDAALDQEHFNMPIMLDGEQLPRGLQSLFCSAVWLKHPQQLPPTLRHLWLSDITTTHMHGHNNSLLHCVAHTLTHLQTLVLRVAWSTSDVSAPATSTGDLALLASSLPHLTCLGLSLPLGTGQQAPPDLRALAPLTGMRQMLLDYCCKPEAAAAPAAALGGAAAAAAAAAAAQQQHDNQVDAEQDQQQDEEEDEQEQDQEQPDGGGDAAAAGGGGGGDAPGGQQPPPAAQLAAAAALAAAEAGVQQQLQQQAGLAQAAAGVAGAVLALATNLDAIGVIDGQVFVPPCENALQALAVAADDMAAGAQGALAASAAAINQALAATQAVLAQAVEAHNAGPNNPNNPNNPNGPQLQAVGPITVPILISSVLSLMCARSALQGMPLPPMPPQLLQLLNLNAAGAIQQNPPAAGGGGGGGLNPAGGGQAAMPPNPAPQGVAAAAAAAGAGAPAAAAGGGGGGGALPNVAAVMADALAAVAAAQGANVPGQVMQQIGLVAAAAQAAILQAHEAEVAEDQAAAAAAGGNAAAAAEGGGGGVGGGPPGPAAANAADGPGVGAAAGAPAAAGGAAGGAAVGAGAAAAGAGQQANDNPAAAAVGEAGGGNVGLGGEGDDDDEEEEGIVGWGGPAFAAGPPLFNPGGGAGFPGGGGGGGAAGGGGGGMLVGGGGLGGLFGGGAGGGPMVFPGLGLPPWALPPGPWPPGFNNLGGGGNNINLGFNPGLPLPPVPPSQQVDAEQVAEQLSDLSKHMRGLAGLWLSDNVLGRYPSMPLQQLLALNAPRITVRAAVSDWFWGTNFPTGSSWNGNDPVEWFLFTPWNIL